MLKKAWALFLTIPLLAACSSSIGIAQQRYNGRVIEVNEPAIAAYAERQEVVGAEKETVGVNVPAFFSQPALPWSGEEFPKGLIEEPTVIGEDVPEGRYTIVKNEVMQSGYLTVADAKGETLFQHFFDFSNNTFEINLYEGMQVSANEGSHPRLQMYGERVEPGAEVVFVGGPEIPPLEEGQYELYNGVHHIGVEVKPGLYDLHILPSSGWPGINYLYILNEDGSFQAIEQTASHRDWQEKGIQLELQEGQVLFVSGAERLRLTTIDE